MPVPVKKNIGYGRTARTTKEKIGASLDHSRPDRTRRDRLPRLEKPAGGSSNERQYNNDDNDNYGT
jgi:hypothetical protein